MTRPKPLSHLRVLDLTRLLPGPMATLHLADFGADVIRIQALTEENGGAGSEFARCLDLLLGRNKRTMALDLRQFAGRDIFLRLAGAADVVVEGFRPGVVERLGIGYEAVRAVNPRVVYCAISGYGQTGPDRLRAGHDINYMACAGVGGQIGASGGPPAIPNLQIGDLLGGSLTAAMGILTAVVDAQARGAGRYVDVSMTDSLMAHSVVALASRMAFGRSAARGEDVLSGGVPCYNYYRAADGRYLAVGALEPKFWERLCDALERPDLKPRQMDPAARGELQAVFAGRDAAEWMRVLDGADCCVTVVLTLDEAMTSAHMQAREMAFEADGVTQFAPPLKMSDFEFRACPPVSAADEVLESAGYSADEVAALRSTRVIG